MVARVSIARRYKHQPLWKKVFALPFVYLPIITTIPFVFLGVVLVRIHLKYIGGMHIKSYWDFVPTWVSHRYTYANQIVPPGSRLNIIRRGRAYWIFNCKVYCPLSVALFRYAAYLVTIIENWWCPFDHDQKKEYSQGAIDGSFWHITPQSMELLHPDDRNNPIWREERGLTWCPVCVECSN